MLSYLVQQIIRYVLSAVIAGAGLFLGIALRKKKNLEALKEAEEFKIESEQ